MNSYFKKKSSDSDSTKSYFKKRCVEIIFLKHHIEQLVTVLLPFIYAEILNIF